jgi:hypothetical protein
LPAESRTVATVVAWWTSRPTYFIELLMRAAPCCGSRLVRNRGIAAGGVLSICVRRLVTCSGVRL